MRSIANSRQVGTALLAFAVASCSPDTLTSSRSSDAATPVGQRGGITHDNAQAALDAVNAANAHAIAVAPSLVDPGLPLAPFVEARLYSIAFIMASSSVVSLPIYKPLLAGSIS